ncbi:MAG TPA: branched-chain amino acid ABC transporter permease [Gaiellaceae bacterium]|nr:branched-chain amino acid ABC transporter permease [Gaiellaceae bacterium]
MTNVLAFSVFGVDWQLLKPFVVVGLAFGGVYALSGVGLVVLYRATGVLNVAFGAIGAAGALIAYYLVNHTGWPHWLAYTICVLFGGVVNLAYGMVFGPAFARRDPLVKMMGTLGLALVLLGIMAWRAPAGGAFARFLPLPSSTHHYSIAGTTVSLTQIICLGLGFVMTIAITLFLQVTKLGTAMRALANDREVTAMLGVPVRQVEAAAWFGTGLLAGAAGLLLPDLLTSLDYSALTFLVIAAPLAAALIGRLRSLWATFFGGLAVGLIRALLAPMAASPYKFMQELSTYRDDAPFVLAIVALLWLSRHRVVTISRSTG